MRWIPVLLLRGLLLVTACLLIGLGDGCGGSSQPNTTPPNNPPVTANIQHVVVIFQENRTLDYFQCFGLTAPTCDVASTGKISTGATLPLTQESLASTWDLEHTHAAWVTAYDSGAMDKFDVPASVGTAPTPRGMYMADPAEIAPYAHLAQTYTVADRFFQTNQGPSSPAHDYIISGTSAIAVGSSISEADNPIHITNTTGCGDPTATVNSIDVNTGATSNQPPCFEHGTLTDELEAAALSWAYYGVAGSPSCAKCVWNSLNQISHICGPTGVAGDCQGSDFTTHFKGTPVLTDIANGTLANVSWVMPTSHQSDHPMLSDASGPSWVISITNAIGGSSYWANTVIFIVWDDWGGFYDHVSPTVAAGVPNSNYPTAGPGILNQYEYGFRVPMIAVSQFAKRGYVSHYTHDFGSILRYIEANWHLGYVGTGTYADARADALVDMFDYSQSNVYAKIDAPLDAHYFLAVDKQPVLPPDLDMISGHGDGDDDDDSAETAAALVDEKMRIPQGIFRLTLLHDLSSKMASGTMFFAADESPAGKGKLYKGHIITFPARRMRGGSMILSFDQPLTVLGHGDEGAVKTTAAGKAGTVAAGPGAGVLILGKGSEAKFKKGTIIEVTH